MALLVASLAACSDEPDPQDPDDIGGLVSDGGGADGAIATDTSGVDASGGADTGAPDTGTPDSGADDVAGDDTGAPDAGAKDVTGDIAGDDTGSSGPSGAPPTTHAMGFVAAGGVAKSSNYRMVFALAPTNTIPMQAKSTSFQMVGGLIRNAGGQ